MEMSPVKIGLVIGGSAVVTGTATYFICRRSAKKQLASQAAGFAAGAKAAGIPDEKVKKIFDEAKEKKAA